MLGSREGGGGNDAGSFCIFCRNRSATIEAPSVTNKKTKRAEALQPQTDGSERQQRGNAGTPKIKKGGPFLCPPLLLTKSPFGLYLRQFFNHIET